MATRDPVADLRRIAFLLERAHSSTYRVRAFRTAANTLAGRDDLDALARGRGLTTVKGVGETTARCVRQSLAGEQPDYLRELEAEATPGASGSGSSGAGSSGSRVSAVPALSGDAAALRAALRGDCHTHSDWSDGGSPIDEMAITARDLGHEYLVLTDHSPRLTVANGLSAERLRRQLTVVAELNTRLAPFTVLTGIEVDILEDGALDQDPELLAELDLVVASVHSKLRMPAAEMTERMLTAVANPHVDVLGHCTGRMVTGSRARPESEFDAAAVFDACAEHVVAVEINSRPERLDPPRRLLRAAVAAGCTFALDTDAHAPGQLDWLPYGCARAAECGVPPDRVLNTLPAASLLAPTRESGIFPGRVGDSPRASRGSSQGESGIPPEGSRSGQYS